MKTNQIMQRVFDDIGIHQRTSDSYFNATDMLAYYNKVNNSSKRFADFWENQNTKLFLDALTTEFYNVDNSAHLDLYTTTRGKGGSTWMHPYLFVKFCFWLSPSFEVKVIKWVYDNLIDFRIDAGDYYKDMSKAILDTYSKWYGKNPDPLVFIKEANYLNLLVYGVSKGRLRNESTENELALLNKLQKLNTSLILDCTARDKRQSILREFTVSWNKTL